MSAIAHIILLVNPNLYRPAIRSYALSVCTAAGMLGLMAAYAAGSTQHLKTSIYIFVLAFLVVMFIAVLFAVAGRKKGKKPRMTGDVADESAIEAGSGAGGGGDTATGALAEGPSDVAGGSASRGGDDEVAGKKKHAKCKYLMLLGILMASVTYQAGLDPPGGVWQSDGDGHTAGDPVLGTNRRLRYLFFFHCNSTSFVASIVVVVLLLPQRLMENGWWLMVTNTTMVLNLLGLLGAHAAGSSRGWETSGYVVALIIAALAYVAVHAIMSFFGRRGRTSSSHLQPDDVPQLKGSVGNQPHGVSV
uniref:PGG domain-containing protein n=1 Tax=Arundo donax TaxID=35708 RepID=A0A0A9B213_ARUDO